MNGKFGPLTNILAASDIKGELFQARQKAKQKQYRYRDLMKGINVYSHSTSGILDLCERKFACAKLEKNSPANDINIVTVEGNIDFAFGRAIESGVQAALLSKTKEQIFFDMFLAWDIGFMQQHPRNYAKTFTDATIAIDKFLWIRKELMQGWEIAMFQGKPAIELSMLIDLENGYYYVGHADVILFHPQLKRYRVLEIKSTGTKNIHPAMYKNSGQSTGYSIFLDEIAKDVELTATFEVFYLVWPTSLDQWILYEFVKSRSQRATWINTLLLDIQRIMAYKSMNFWPKRGGSCFEYGRPCQYLDSCDLYPQGFNPDGQFYMTTPEDIEKHSFDFKFKLSDILKTQSELVK